MLVRRWTSTSRQRPRTSRDGRHQLAPHLDRVASPRCRRATCERLSRSKSNLKATCRRSMPKLSPRCTRDEARRISIAIEAQQVSDRACLLYLLELIFKKGSDGFFNCIICRAYTKPHPILFKIHLVRCAAEYEDYPTDTSDSEAESDTSYVSTAKVKGNGKAAMETDSDDAGSGSGSGPGSDNDGEGKHKQAEKDRTAERAVRREKLAAKNATRKEKRVAKMQRREKRERVEAKEVREKKPKIRKENRKIPSLARPTGGASRNGGYGLARVKKQRPASTDDEVEHIDVKPLGGTKRQQPFARSAAVTLDQEHLVVDSDDSESDEDDDTIVVLVRGSGG